MATRYVKLRSASYFALGLMLSTSVFAEDALIPELPAGNRIYYGVKVKKITPQGILILHKGGLAQVLFKDMSPEWRAKFGYDAEAEARFSEEREAARNAQIEKENREREAKRREEAESAQAMAAVSHWPLEIPVLRPEVDLRTRFRLLGLGSKDQNRRSSCAVFSVVTALEFAYSERYRKPSDFSEEFIIWAVRHFDDPKAGIGQGFSLWTIMQRLLQSGIAENAIFREWTAQDQGADMPPAKVLENAAARKNIKTRWIYPNFGREAFYNQVVHALNDGKPVVIGLRWPHEKTIMNTSLLSTQPPVGLHAVTLVGYRSAKREPEELRFIFKNSWGRNWGVGGCGFMTYEYFIKNVLQGFTLDYS